MLTFNETGLSSVSLYQQRLIATPTGYGTRLAGMVLILSYAQPAVNANDGQCCDWRVSAAFTVKRNSCGVIQPTRPATFDFTPMWDLVKVKICHRHRPVDGLRRLLLSLET
jgi:hypothetical protein